MKIENLLFIDVETTGQDPSKHSIIQLSAEYHENGKKIKGIDVHMEPHEGSEINLSALKYNGVTYGALKSKGFRCNALKTFIDFLLGLPKDKPIYLCGHNVAFDVNFIKQWLKNNNVTGIESIMPYRVQDTSTIGMFLASEGVLDMPKGFNFEKLVNTLGFKPEENTFLHNSKVDVELTAKIYYKLRSMLQEVKRK